MSLLAAAFASSVVLGAATPELASDPAFLALKAKAEACIRDNAAAVERADASLTDAASFLLDYVCGTEIENYKRYDTNAKIIAAMQRSDRSAMRVFVRADDDDQDKAIKAQMAVRERQAERYKGATLNPDTGAIVFAPGAPDDPVFGSVAADLAEELSFGAPISFKTLAAHAVLDARQSRLAH